MENFPLDSDGWVTTKNTQVTDGFLTSPSPPPITPYPSLSINILHFERGKRPTLPNNYEIFTGESYLQFLQKTKLSPLQKKNNPIYEP